MGICLHARSVEDPRPTPHPRDPLACCLREGRGKVLEDGECRGKITQSLTMRGMLQSQVRESGS